MRSTGQSPFSFKACSSSLRDPSMCCAERLGRMSGEGICGCAREEGRGSERWTYSYASLSAARAILIAQRADDFVVRIGD